MRDQFTITISNVHGARHYSFNQFVLKFVWALVALLFFIWVAGASSIWWLNQQAIKVQARHEASISAFNSALKETRTDYESLLVERNTLEEDLAEKTNQIEFLDKTLQGLEELMEGEVEPDSLIPYEERLKRVQLSALGKDLMLATTPNGYPLVKYSGTSSKFGYRKHPISGERLLHGGLDFRADTGDDVIATADGVVQYSAMNNDAGFGNLVTVVHSNGFKTSYAHLSKRIVKVGQYVRKGEKIGEVGNTGRSSGPHLHYEVAFVNRRLNPSPFTKWSLEKYDSIFDKVKGVPWGSLSQVVDNRVKKVEKQLSLRDVSLAAK